MHVVIMRGIPGSGKSTWVAKNYPDALKVSADDYFYNDIGEYKFDSKMLPQAHGMCLRAFTTLVTRTQRNETIVVDNTNISATEIAPYYALAEAYGHTVEIVQLSAEPLEAFSRGLHGVPLTAIQGMLIRMNTQSFPPWWKITHVS